MTQEEIIFRVGVDTNDAKKPLNDLQDGLENVNNEVDDTNKSFTNLRKELKQLTIQLQNLDPASKEFEAVARRAGEIKEQMRGVADAINDADPEVFGGKFQRTAEGIAGAFSAVTGAQALFGANSEEIEKQMLKVQGAIALTQGISAMKELKNDSLDLAMSIKKTVVGAFTSLTTAELVNAEATGTMTLLQKAYTLAVGTSTGALKVFKLALVTTGIGAIVVLIGLLIEKIMAFASNTDEATRAQDRFTSAMERYNKAQERNRKNLEDQLDYQLQYAKAVGMSEEGLYKLEKTQIEKRQKLRQSEFEDNKIHLTYLRMQKKDALEDENTELVKSINEEITKIKEKNNSLIDEKYSLIRQDSLLTANYNKAQIEQQRKNNEDQKKNQKESNDKQLEIQKKHEEDKLFLKRKFEDLATANIQDDDLRQQRELELKHQREIEDLKKQYGDKVKLKQEFDKMMLELENNQKLETDKLLEEQSKSKEEKRQEDQDLLNLDAKSQLEAELLRLENDFTAKQQKRLELEEFDFQEQLQKKDLTNGEIERITAQHEANVLAIQQESKDRQIEIDNAIAEAKFNLANNIGSAIGSIGNLFAQGSKQAKAFALIQLGIDTASGYMSALRIAQQSAQGTGPAAAFSMPIFYATQIGSVLGAVAKAKSILNAGPSVQPPRVNSASPVSGAGSEQGVSSTPTQVTATQTYKVVVVDSDITKMQEKTKKTELISTI